jgi:cytochrome c553
MKRLAILLLVLLVVYACAENQVDKGESQKEMKMAEFSELALLMKEIHEDAKKWKAELEAGERPTDSLKIYEKIVTSTPTKAEVKGPVFEGFASMYQARLDSLFYAGELDMAKDAYNNLISSCVDCHGEYCPGPIPTIEKLYISEAK